MCGGGLKGGINSLIWNSDEYLEPYVVDSCFLQCVRSV